MAPATASGTSRTRRTIKRWVRRIPAPRDRAAIGVLRNARSFVTGAEPPAPRTTRARRSAASAKPARRRGRQAPTYSADGLPGRWIRVVRPRGKPERVLDRQGADPMEAAAVRAGWLLVDAHERLSWTGARRIFGHENDAWREYTEDSLVKLRQPPEDEDFLDHESMTNLQRYRRTMDFVRPGDRVFDVGFGRGYLAAQLVQVCGIESYEGIDVLDEFLSMSLRLFEVNDLADAAIHLETGDLYDLTRDRLDAVGATLVICCEVLEHVADPELALRTLADALPDGADLLFSVPLHGRLEGVWGHVTVFDVARLKDMLDAAGLTAHHVEPLANTWTLIVASRSSEASRRVREAHGRPAVRASYPLVAHRDYRTLRAGDGTPTGPSSDVATEMDEEGDSWVTCRVTDRGGVSWKVAGLEALRLRFDLVDIEHVRRFVVAAYAGRRRVGTWVWSPRPDQVLTGVRTFSLRPGEQAAHFASGPHRRLFRADHVEIRAVTSRGKRATFKVRAAYLP